MRRLATLHDIEAVHAICSHEKVLPYLTYERMPLEDFGPIYQPLLDSGSFFVWEQDGVVAGFYRATRLPGRAGHVVQLGTLAVDPRRHGQGVALAMVGDAIARLKADASVRRVELYAEADNERGLRFYRKLGFVEEGRLRDFYKRAGQDHFVDELVMGLLLR